MTPLSIEIEGIRSFITSRTIDFAGLELFAIIGDTGAGKSSILEAMIYALYNGTTWDGKNVKELMSTVATRMRVRFRFELAGRKYSITRITPRVGAASHLLECDGNANERRDGERAVAARLKELLGVDRDQFIKTVVLPQGEFAALLTLEPGKRATLLADVLGLGTIDDMAKYLGNIRSRANALRAKLSGMRSAYPADPAADLAVADELAEQRKRDEQALQNALGMIASEESVLTAIGQRAERRASLIATIATIAPELLLLRSLSPIDAAIQTQVHENEQERAVTTAQLAAAADALARGNADGLDPQTIAASENALERLRGQCAELSREVQEFDVCRTAVDSVELLVEENATAAASASAAAERARVGEAVAKKFAEKAIGALEAADQAWTELSAARVSFTKTEDVHTRATTTLTRALAFGASAKQVANDAQLTEAAAKTEADLATRALHQAEKSWSALSHTRTASANAEKARSLAITILGTTTAELARAKKSAQDAQVAEASAKKESDTARSALHLAEKAWQAFTSATALSTKAAEARTSSTAHLAVAKAEIARTKRFAEHAQVGEGIAKKKAEAAISALQLAENAWNALSIAKTSFSEASKAEALANATLAAASAEGQRAKRVDADAERDLDQAQVRLDAAERTNAAAKAAYGLAHGDACPVCASVLPANFNPPAASDLVRPRREAKEAESRRREAARIFTQTEAQLQFAEGALEKAASEAQRWRSALDDAMAEANTAGIDPALESNAAMSAIRQRARTAELRRNAAAETHVQAVRDHARADAQLEDAAKRVAEAETEFLRSQLALDEARAEATAVGINLTFATDSVLAEFRERATVAEAHRSASADVYVRAERAYSRADTQMEEAQNRVNEVEAELHRSLVARSEATAEAAAVGIDLVADSGSVLAGFREHAHAAEFRRSAAAEARVEAERGHSRADAELREAQKRAAEADAELGRSRLALSEAKANATAAGIEPFPDSDARLTEIRDRAKAAEAERSRTAAELVRAERAHSRADMQLEDAQKRLAETKAEIARRQNTITNRRRGIASLRAHIPTAYLTDSDALTEAVLADAAAGLHTAAETSRALAGAHIAALQAERSVVEAAGALDLRRRLEIERPVAERRRRLVLAGDALGAAGFAVPPHDDGEGSLPRTLAWSGAIASVSVDATRAIAKEERDDTSAMAAAKGKIADCLRNSGVTSVDLMRSKRDEALLAVGGAVSAREDLARAVLAVTELDTQRAQVEPLSLALDALHRHLGDSKFKKFATDRKQDKLLGVATSILRRMTNDRYGFGADMRIVDRSASQARSPETLSGGEKFLASLALALGLVEIARRSGRHFGALFLDEGFGSLDPQALDEVLSELERQAESGRIIGVITHVASVVEYIDDVLRVVRTPSGSQVIRSGADELPLALAVTGST